MSGEIWNGQGLVLADTSAWIVALYGVLDRIAPGPVVLVLKTPVVSAVSERAISGARPAALQTSR